MSTKAASKTTKNTKGKEFKSSSKKYFWLQDSLFFSVFNRKLFASTVRKNIESLFWFKQNAAFSWLFI